MDKSGLIFPKVAHTQKWQVSSMPSPKRQVNCMPSPKAAGQVPLCHFD
jgi:hypothetical protein